MHTAVPNTMKYERKRAGFLRRAKDLCRDAGDAGGEKPEQYATPSVEQNLLRKE